MLPRVRARKGMRIVKEHRCGYVQLFSATCTETETAIGHACAMANTAEMNRHLPHVGETVPVGRHAPVLLDGAGWHTSKELEVPVNVSLRRLPPCCSELNPIKTLFAVLMHLHFASRVFGSAERSGNPSGRCGTGSSATVWRSCGSQPEAGPCCEIRGGVNL